MLHYKQSKKHYLTGQKFYVETLEMCEEANAVWSCPKHKNYAPHSARHRAGILFLVEKLVYWIVT